MATNKTKIINSAQKHLQKGNFDRAIRELQKLVDEDPRDLRTLLKIGDIYSKKGDKHEATRVYSQVAEYYGEQGFFLKAVAVYKQILKYDGKNLDVTIKLAELYEHLGLIQEAMAQYQLIANMFEEVQNFQEVREILRKMVDLDPENVASRVRLAESYSRDSMISDAVTQFDEAAKVLKSQNRQTDYVKVAERLAYHDPSRIDVLKELAGLYLDRNDPKRAIAKLQIAFKATPEDVSTLEMLARAFNELDQTHKTVFVYRELARVFRSHNRINESVSTYQKLLDLAPNDEDARAAIDELMGKPRPPTEPPPPPEDPAEAQAAIRQPVRRSMTGEMPIQMRQDLPEDLPAPTEDHLVPAEIQARAVPVAQNPEAPVNSPGAMPSIPISVDAIEDEAPAPSAPVPHTPVDARASSPAEPSELDKLLTETDVYIRYGLRDKALEHLKKVIGLEPDNLVAFRKMREVYDGLNDKSRAAEALANMVRIHATRGEHDQAEALRSELGRLAPGHPGAQPGSIPPMAAAAFDESIDIDVAFDEESSGLAQSAPDTTSDIAPVPTGLTDDIGDETGISVDLLAGHTSEADEPLITDEEVPVPATGAVDEAMVDMFQTGEVDIPEGLPPAAGADLTADLSATSGGPDPFLEQSAVDLDDEDLVEVQEERQPEREAYVGDLVPSHIGESDLPTETPRHSIPVEFDEPDPPAEPPRHSIPVEFDEPVEYAADLESPEPPPMQEPAPAPDPFAGQFDAPAPAASFRTGEFEEFGPPGTNDLREAHDEVHHTADLAAAIMDEEVEADEPIPFADDEVALLGDEPSLPVEEEDQELGILSAELEDDDMLLNLDLSGAIVADDEDSDVEEELDETDFLVAQELYDEAREQLLEILSRNPLYPRAVSMLDVVEEKMGLRSAGSGDDDGGLGALDGLDEIFADAVVSPTDGEQPSGVPQNGTHVDSPDPGRSDEPSGGPSDGDEPPKKNKITYL